MPEMSEFAKSVGSVLAEKLPTAYKIALLLSNLENRWEEIVGPRLAAHSKPESVDRTGLVVLCDTPAAGQLFKMGAVTYLQRVEKKFDVKISGIRTVVVTRLERRRPDSEKRIRKLFVPKSFVDEAMAEVEPKIKNAAVAAALARARAAARARYGAGRKNENNQDKKEDVQK